MTRVNEMLVPHVTVLAMAIRKGLLELDPVAIPERLEYAAEFR